MLSEDDFERLSFVQRVDLMEKRIGGYHEDRITSLAELFDLIGETVYFVFSPFGPQEKTNLGNSYFYEWKIGSIIDQNKNEITDRNSILEPDETENYFCIDDSETFKAINVMDLNIIPNVDNNHAAFKTKEGAEAYMVYRKLTWPVDGDIDNISKQYNPWLNEKQIRRKGSKK